MLRFIREYNPIMIRYSTFRRLTWLAVMLLGAAVVPGVAYAQSKPAKPAQAPAAPAQPQASQLGTFGAWGAYMSDTANGRVCYVLAQPKERLPDAINGVKLNRDPAFLFVSTRPQDNVRNEVSFVLGFPAKEDVDAQVVIGKTSFAVRTKTDASWLKNPKDDGALVELMKKSPSLSFKATSRRGNALTDNYVLSGFTQALDRARKECP
jgi:invasion protein IalB